MKHSTKIAIVGASIAGVAAAEASRSVGYRGEVHLYDAQSVLPYDRPPLSKGILTGEQTIEAIALKSDEQWKELDVDLRLGCAVLNIDRHLTLTTEAGSESYDGIILAPGTQARVAPFPIKPGVRTHVLRTTDDALALRKAIKESTQVVIVGGGFIGLEVASAVTRLGKQCTVVEAAPVPLERAVGGDIAQFVLDRHRAAGCQFRTGTQVLRIEEGVRGRAVVCLSDNTTLEADLVLLSIGVEPTTGFLLGSGLRIDNGIVTNGYCQTSNPHVYACGDAANAYSLLFRRHLRIEHWTTAREQGAQAAANLVADLTNLDRSPFVHVPYVWSDQHDLKIQIAGRFLDGATTRIQHRDDNSVTATFWLDGVLVGGAAINRVRDVMKIRQTLAAGLNKSLPGTSAH